MAIMVFKANTTTAARGYKINITINISKALRNKQDYITNTIY